MTPEDKEVVESILLTRNSRWFGNDKESQRVYLQAVAIKELETISFQNEIIITLLSQIKENQ